MGYRDGPKRRAWMKAYQAAWHQAHRESCRVRCRERKRAVRKRRRLLRSPSFALFAAANSLEGLLSQHPCPACGKPVTGDWEDIERHAAVAHSPLQDSAFFMALGEWQLAMGITSIPEG